MKSQKRKYEDHIKLLTKGFIRNNREEAKKHGLDYDRVYELIKQELPYQNYLAGSKLKKIKINNMQYESKMHTLDPSRLQDPTEIKVITSPNIHK